MDHIVWIDLDWILLGSCMDLGWIVGIVRFWDESWVDLGWILIGYRIDLGWMVALGWILGEYRWEIEWDLAWILGGSLILV